MTLITVAELAERIDDPDVVVCDVRFHLADHARGRREYDEAHLPGAVFVDLHTELAGRSGGGRHPLPPVDAFTDLLGRLGIGPGSRVVAYDSAGGAIAARLWWMLRSIGHADVAVLDGGYQEWIASGRPVSREVPARAPMAYPRVERWTGIVDADEVDRAIDRGVAVIDARTPARFRGEHEPLDARAGHIPGAINRFHGDNLGPDGRHRPVAELAARFADLGTDPIVYCGSGVTACHDLLAMASARITGGRLYPGSWSEWSADPDRPVATGD